MDSSSSNQKAAGSSQGKDDVFLRDVFLSHSGSQKDFVRQLHVDMRRLNISSFFDQDNESLPKGKKFSPLIFQNIKHCKVAVVVLSNAFLTSKWPMLELSAIVKAKEEDNPGLHILPLFYNISHEDLYQKLEKDEFKEEWEKIKKREEEDEEKEHRTDSEEGSNCPQKLEKDKFKESEETENKETIKKNKHRIDIEKWRNSLKFIRHYKALHRTDCKYTTDVDYRESVVKEVVDLLPSNRLFDDSHVLGSERLCLEVDRMFNKVEEIGGLKVLGLHGIGGCGKTTICKCLCNFYEAEFKGKVFYIEFRNGAPVETHKQLLQVIGSVDKSALDKFSTKDQVLRILRGFMKEYKVFFALDGLYGDETKSMEDARSFLKMDYKEGSKIIMTSRHADNFESGRLRQAKIPFVGVPHLQEDEATNILLKDTVLYKKELSFQLKEMLNIFTTNCIFADAYNPSALKKLGEYLCEKFGSDPTKWQVIPNLVDLHWLAEKIYWYYELLMWYVSIGLQYPHLYLAINLLLGKVIFKEFSSVLFILGRALLKAFQSASGFNGFFSTVMDILRTEEFKELLNRVGIKDIVVLFKNLLTKYLFSG